jgi:hypothetical protein
MFQELQFEQSLYIGNLVLAVFFGIALTLCIQSSFYLLKHGHRKPRNYFYVFYSILLMLFYTISMASNATMGQRMWIDHRDIPGGPPAYFGIHVNDWYNTFGSAASVALMVTADTLMLYRCFIVLGSQYRYILLPGLTLASTALGIVSVVSSAEPQNFLFSGNSASFGSAMASLSVVYNGMVTLLICGKVLYVKRRVKGLSPGTGSHVYTNVIAIVIESALPYALAGIMFAATFNETSISLGFKAPWAGFAAISPQLIILRVAMGTAWSKNTLTDTYELKPSQSNHVVRGPQSETYLGGEEPKFATHSIASA